MSLKPPYMSGAAARKLGISTTALHAKDDQLRPARADNGYRLYDADQIDQLAAERAARRAGATTEAAPAV